MWKGSGTGSRNDHRHENGELHLGMWPESPPVPAVFTGGGLGASRRAVSYRSLVAVSKLMVLFAFGFVFVCIQSMINGWGWCVMWCLGMRRDLLGVFKDK